MSKSLFQKPVEIKISTVVAVSAILTTADGTALDAALSRMTGGSADFFEDDLTVIDIAALPEGTAVDWPALIAVLTKYRLKPVAVRHAPATMAAEIAAYGLTLETASKPRDDDAAQAALAPNAPGAPGAPAAPGAPMAASAAAARAEPKAAPTPTPASAPSKAAPTISSTAEPLPNSQNVMIIDTPVRAGQRIYARGCDLIVTAVVNNGAEIIADGSIHVYNTLNGRALAGASGNADARIFALNMSPELVSIAGVYRTFEDGFPAEFARSPAQIRLMGDRIDILSVNSATRA